MLGKKLSRNNLGSGIHDCYCASSNVYHQCWSWFSTALKYCQVISGSEDDFEDSCSCQQVSKQIT
ncbi:hypothetical protein OROHE_002702 [Orobanche hederae]